MSVRAEDLASFSLGCFKVAKALIDLAGQGYNCLLIPCRGASPVSTGAVEALKTVERGTELLERFCASYSHPAFKEVRRKRGDFKLLILPFTAHVKLPEEYRRRYSFHMHIDEVEKSIRLWTVRLALSFLRDADSRALLPEQITFYLTYHTDRL